MSGRASARSLAAHDRVEQAAASRLDAPARRPVRPAEGAPPEGPQPRGPARAPRSGAAWAAARAREEALVLLGARGCPVCRFAGENERQFFVWFLLEKYTELETIVRLRAALGMCPAHSRRLLALADDSTLTSIYQDVVTAALARLGGKGGEGRCPACDDVAWATGYASRSVLAALAEPPVAAAYEAAGGLCLPHLLGTLVQPRPELLPILLRVLGDRLKAEDREAGLLALLGGGDPDAPVRKRLRERLPDDEAVESFAGRRPTAADRLRQSLRVNACPVCLAAGRMERRYLAWIRQERVESAAQLGLEVAGLCPVHLHDLAALDPPAAAWLARVKRELWLGELQRLEARLRVLPAATLRDRLRALPACLRPLGATERARRWEALRSAARLVRARVFGSRRRALDLALAPVRRTQDCGACRAVATAEQRETALLLAALADRPLARAYERTHGLCVHHLLRLPPGARAAIPRRLGRARLGLLAWELEESVRKVSWSVRYESRGTEATAWLRAPALLDGRVFLGGPPVALR